MSSKAITVNEWSEFNLFEQVSALADDFKSYTQDDYVCFADEYGWAEWMSAYLSDTDSEPTEQELGVIDLVLRGLWDEYFNKY